MPVAIASEIRSSSANLDAQSISPPREFRALQKFAPLAFICIAFLVYAPALRAGFVWDDRALILSDPLIRSWRLTWEGFQHFLFTDAAASDFYRPLQRLSYTLDYAAFVFAPFGYHVVSLLWHVAAAIAFFFFAEELLAFCQMGNRRTLAAFFATLVWLVHPVQNAAVAYVSGRADPLAAAFGFLALFFGLRMLRVRKGRKLLLSLCVGLCLLASALSKESGLLFSALWLMVVAVRFRPNEFLRALGLVAAVPVVYFSLRLPAEHLPPPATAPEPLLVRSIVVARAAAEYAGLLILPLHLHMDRDVKTASSGLVRPGFDSAKREWQTLLGAVLIGIAACALWRVRRRREIFLPWVLAIVSYLPISGIVTLNASVAEHWLYLPSAFLFLGLSAAFFSLGEFARHGAQTRLLTVCLTSWLIFLPLRTFVRAGDWKDERTFLERNIAAGGDSARMWINLGGLELSEGNLARAQADEERALTKEPEHPLALLNLGAIAIKQRDFARARSILAKIEQPPELAARAQESLAVLENRETGQVNFLRLRLAAHLGPPNWAIEKRYVKALADAGFSDRAIVELHGCLTIAPYRAESWQTIAELLAKIGRPNESMIAMREAKADDVHLREHKIPTL